MPQFDFYVFFSIHISFFLVFFWFLAAVFGYMLPRIYKYSYMVTAADGILLIAYDFISYKKFTSFLFIKFINISAFRFI